MMYLNKNIDGFVIEEIVLGGILYIGKKEGKKYVLSISDNKSMQLSMGYDSIELFYAPVENNASKSYIEAKIEQNGQHHSCPFSEIKEEYEKSLK